MRYVVVSGGGPACAGRHTNPAPYVLQSESTQQMSEHVEVFVLHVRVWQSVYLVHDAPKAAPDGGEPG